MSTIYSIGLQNHVAGSGSLYSGVNNCAIGIWSGPVPASADVAVGGSCVLLATINNGGTAGTFNPTPTNGVLSKTSSENWSGSVVATGTATFFRLYIPGSADTTGATNDASFAYMRVQGAVGTDVTSEMVLPTAALTSGNTQAINLFQLD